MPTLQSTPGSSEYLLQSRGLSFVPRTVEVQARLAGTSSVHSLKSYRDCLEAAVGLQDPEVVGALTLCWDTPPAIHFVLLKLPLLGLLSP